MRRIGVGGVRGCVGGGGGCRAGSAAGSPLQRRQGVAAGGGTSISCLIWVSTSRRTRASISSAVSPGADEATDWWSISIPTLASSSATTKCPVCCGESDSVTEAVPIEVSELGLGLEIIWR